MVSTREDPTPAGVVSHPSRAAPRVLALLLTACLLLPLGLPALSGSSVPVLPGVGDGDGSSGSPSSDWPPPAWQEGDMSEVSLVELALLASDSLPSPENRAELERGLAPLEDMPPEHTELTRVVLEGLAQARWHQVQAMRHLSDEQRAIVASAHPDRPLPEGWDGVMAAVDHHELAKSLLALESASMRTLAILHHHPADEADPHGVAAALSSATGVPPPSAWPVLGDHGLDLDLMVQLVALVTGTELLPEEVRYVEESLAGIPGEARAALHVVLEGLVPFAAGASANPGPALVRLGAAADAAEETLLVWSTAALAKQIHYVQTGPGIVIPDADAERPPLHFGVPRLRHPDAPLPPAPSLPDALGELALVMGDRETARNAEELSAPVMAVLPDSQQAALAQMLAQGARYIRAHEALGELPVPQVLVDDPGLLASWALHLDEGLPEPGSLDADELLGARSWLSAQLEAILAREDLMTAIQEAVGELTPQPQPQSSSAPEDGLVPDLMMPMSSPTQELGVECPLELEIIGVAPYFLIEPCGTDTVWQYDEHQAMFVVDVGGSDTYQGPFASAPFEINVPFLDVVSPLAVHLDLGGSDLYNATGFDCALAAICAQDGLVPNLAILIDWGSENVSKENKFISGSYSQGFSRPIDILSGVLPGEALDGWAPTTSLLIERIGAGSSLHSFYEAGDFSQGVVNSMNNAWFGAHAIGSVIRLIGEQSNATGVFQAGDRSQGFLDGRANQRAGGGLAALLNVAGPQSVSSSRYVAGEYVQGATTVEGSYTQGLVGTAVFSEAPLGVALFADIMGSGGQSDDVYVAIDKGRAYGSGAFFFDILLPESVDHEGLLDVSTFEDALIGPPKSPGPNDLFPPSFPEALKPDSEESTRPGVKVHAATTGNRSSNDDTYILTTGEAQMGHGWAVPAVPTANWAATLFLDHGGNNAYPEESPATNNHQWAQPDGAYTRPTGIQVPITGMDTSALRDEDADFFPYFLEELLGTSDDASDDAHPTGRRVVLDFGSAYPFLNDTHAFVLRLTGNSEYGTGFSSAVLLDLQGDNKHFGRTAAATRAVSGIGGGGPIPSVAIGEDGRFQSSAQNLLSFILDLDGDDEYRSGVDGSFGFGAGGAAGILFDLGGNDRYNGTAFTQGVGIDRGLGVLVDLKNRVDRNDPFGAESHEVNRFRADGQPAQGHGAGAGIGILVADGDHNTFEDGERMYPLPPTSWIHQLRELLIDLDDVALPEEINESLDQIGEAIPEFQETREETESEIDEFRQILSETEKTVFDELIRLIDETWGESGLGDEISLPGGLQQSGEGGGAGGSFNMGENQPPKITAWSVKSPMGDVWEGDSEDPAPAFLVVNVPYTFTASVADDDDDRMEVCWEFEKGDGETDRSCRFSEEDGTVQVEYVWEAVHTDARSPGIDKNVSYEFELSVTDPGGLSDSRSSVPRVKNEPLPLAANELRRPTTISMGQPLAVQLPFVAQGRDDLPVAPDDEMVMVDWGDGSGGLFSATAVDWARLEWGSTIELQSGLPPFPDDPSQDMVPPFVENLHNMANGDPGSSASFAQPRFDLVGEATAPATVVVEFAGPRQIRQVALNASLGSDSAPLHLGLDGVRADGSTYSFLSDEGGASGIVALGDGFNRAVWNLTDFPDLKGLVLRQLDSDPGETRTFLVSEISSLGPGAIKGGGWSQPGSYSVDYTVLDRFGGRNGLTETVHVLGVGGEGEHVEPSVELVDIGGRGDVRNASLAIQQSYEMVLGFEHLNRNDKVCVDWGDGSGTCVTAGDEGVPTTGTVTLSNSWADPGNYDITITFDPVGVVVDVWTLATAHVETALDLRTGDTPILFMTFEDRSTWHEGIDYQAIVDAGGDDRYFGRVAASIPAAPGNTGLLPGVLMPMLVLDAGGDDLYISDDVRTQAFATHFGVSLLLDAQGDDTFLAGGEAQAAATRGGVAALVSLEGRDIFNPVHVGHPVVAEAFTRSGNPTPHGIFREGRPIGRGPDMVQGAAEDGVAILVTAGGPALLHAGDKAQGYGGHEVPNVDHYVFPGADSDCGDSPAAGVGNLLGADLVVLFCLLGIDNFRDPTDPNNLLNFYNPLNNAGRSDSPYHFWCQTISTGTPTICPSGQPDASVLAGYLSDGPRYSPGFGALVRLDGPAGYHAGADAQGRANPDGRGLFLDLDGASMLLAGERGQAYSESGLTGTMLGGLSVMRLDNHGQAVYEEAEESPEGGLTTAMRGSFLVTRGSDQRCAQEGCGPGEPPFSFGMDLESGPDVPGVIVNVPDEEIFEIKVVDVEIDLVHPVANEFDVAAFAVAFAPGEQGECVGPSLAAPALVHQGHMAESGKFGLDLGRLIAGTDPLLPAGCTEIHVFARPVQDVAGSVVPLGNWGHGTDTVLLLPPPRIPSEGDHMVTHGQQVEVEFRITEPLADLDEVELRLFNATTGNVIDEGGLTVLQGGVDTLVVQWIPPTDLEDGAQELQVRFPSWPGPESPWVAVRTIVFERLPPGEVEFDLNTPNPLAVGGDRQVQLSGTTQRLIGLSIRLVEPEDDSQVQPVRPWGPLGCSADADAVDAINADVLGNPLEQQVWKASFCLQGPLHVQDGDQFVVQYRTSGNDWSTLTNATDEPQRIIFAGEPPRVERIATPDGFSGASSAGNATAPVQMCVVLEHNGIGVDRKDTSVTVIGRTPHDGLRRLSIEDMGKPGAGDQDACEAAMGPDLKENQMVFGYHWYEEGREDPLPEDWGFDIYVLARDRAGGLFDHNPGFRFPIDRTDPVILDARFELPSMTHPDGSLVGQTALKPGDVVELKVWASDDNMDVVRAVALPALEELVFVKDEGEGDHFAGSIEVPANPGGVSSDGKVRLVAEAIDRAGNKAEGERWVRFEPEQFVFTDGPVIEERSASLEVRWSLDRALDKPGDGVRAILRDVSDSVDLAIQAAIVNERDYRVTFPGLQSNTDYIVALQLWDGAGWVLDWKDGARTLGVPFGTQLKLTTDSEPIYSGEIPLDGFFLAGSADTSGVLRVHADKLENPLSGIRFEGGSLDPLTPTDAPLQVGKGESSQFTLVWDSTTRVPVCVVEDADCPGAQEVKLYLVFTDGSLTWNDNVTLRIDNTPPRLGLGVFGPEPNNGWYNGTIVVGADVDDASPPFSHTIEVLGVTDGPVKTETVTLEEDGVYDLVITVADGAVPPNVAQLAATVRVDRSLPELNATSGLDQPWTNEPSVPLSVAASDEISGLEGVRVRAANLSWSQWMAQGATNVTLEGLGDGQHVIQVQARDLAGNVRHQEINVILDRAAPELVDARWVGWSEGDPSRPVLLVVAQDVLAGEGRPSGMDAVRFAPSAGGPWTGWVAIGSTGTFEINQTNDGLVWVQLRDRVGNVGEPVVVDKGLPDRLDEALDDGGVMDMPAGALIRDLFFSPEEGGPNTYFSFSATVFPFDGSLPDRVALDVGGLVHDMEVEGPVLEGGARIYTATLRLPTSSFVSPHTFRVVALYGDDVVVSPEKEGPVVIKFEEVDPGIEETAEDQQGFSVPGVIEVLLVVVLLGVLAFRRRNLQSWINRGDES